MAASYVLPGGRFLLTVREEGPARFLWTITHAGVPIATSDRDYARFWTAKRGGERVFDTERARFDRLALRGLPVAE